VTNVLRCSYSPSTVFLYCSAHVRVGPDIAKHALTKKTASTTDALRSGQRPCTAPPRPPLSHAYPWSASYVQRGRLLRVHSCPLLHLLGPTRRSLLPASCALRAVATVMLHAHISSEELKKCDGDVARFKILSSALVCYDRVDPQGISGSYGPEDVRHQSWWQSRRRSTASERGGRGWHQRSATHDTSAQRRRAGPVPGHRVRQPGRALQASPSTSPALATPWPSTPVSCRTPSSARSSTRTPSPARGLQGARPQGDVREAGNTPNVVPSRTRSRLPRACYGHACRTTTAASL
jgi:hypothetical protein